MLSVLYHHPASVVFTYPRNKVEKTSHSVPIPLRSVNTPIEAVQARQHSNDVAMYLLFSAGNLLSEQSYQSLSIDHDIEEELSLLNGFLRQSGSPLSVHSHRTGGFYLLNKGQPVGQILSDKILMGALGIMKRSEDVMARDCPPGAGYDLLGEVPEKETTLGGLLNESA